MDIILQYVINAISLGGIYAMLALGLALIFSVMGFLNFAHAELLTICGYTIVAAMALGAPFALAAIVGVTAAAAGGALMERIAFRPLRNASADTLQLTSFALAAAIQVSFQVFVSARALPVQTPAFLNETIYIGPLRIGVLQTITIVTALLAMTVLHRFFSRSLLGISMRAAATNFNVARLMGIRANTVITMAFVIAGALAGVASILFISLRGSVEPQMSLNPLVKALIAASIGGLGGLSGPVIGGFMLGALEVTIQLILPPGFLVFRDPVVLTILVGFLIFMPNGVTGTRALRAR